MHRKKYYYYLDCWQIHNNILWLPFCEVQLLAFLNSRGLQFRCWHVASWTIIYCVYSKLANVDFGLIDNFLSLCSPTYGDGVADEDLNSVYLEAQRAGEYGVECDTLYPRCEMDSGFLGLFSIIENELGYT